MYVCLHFASQAEAYLLALEVWATNVVFLSVYLCEKQVFIYGHKNKERE